MRAKQIIVERATPILYHYTNSTDAAKILKDGVFRLSSVTGNDTEEALGPMDKPFFFSTTRSKVGDYHRYVGGGGVMFVLDGNWFNSRYTTKPVDYWDRMWNHPGTGRTRESEDRVFSKQPTIPIDGIISVHAFLKEHNEWRSPATRQLLIAAKTRKIPAYFYTDEKAWRLQDTRHAVSPAQATELLKGEEQTRRQYKFNDYLEGWLELVYKNKQQDLSKIGEKLRYNVVYYNRGNPNEDNGLKNELFNARKPGNSDNNSAIKVIQYLKKNNLTPYQLANAMYAKWKKIGDEQREKNLATKPNQTT